jgi:hypothetical protein
MSSHNIGPYLGKCASSERSHDLELRGTEGREVRVKSDAAIDYKMIIMIMFVIIMLIIIIIRGGRRNG